MLKPSQHDSARLFSAVKTTKPHDFGTIQNELIFPLRNRAERKNRTIRNDNTIFMCIYLSTPPFRGWEDNMKGTINTKTKAACKGKCGMTHHKQPRGTPYLFLPMGRGLFVIDVKLAQALWAYSQNGGV